MDQKLLDAFNNLSVALQQIADALDQNNKNTQTTSSAIVDSLKKLDIVEQVKSIDEGVKKLKSDNEKIVSEQKKIVDMVQKMSQKQEGDSKIIRTQQQSVKKKEEQSKDLGSVTDEKGKKTIMDGVKVIVLMAAGILALGLAFKVIGEVDWKSVLSLSLAMPILAFAFEKIAKVKVSLKDMAVATLGFIMMAGAIVASSFILKYTQTVSTSQVGAILLIGGVFALLSYSIGKLAKSMEGISVKDLWKMPLVLVAASAAIALSSHILQYVAPVSLLQVMTTIFIAGAFTLLSYSIGKLAASMEKVSVKDLWKMPLVLVAASAAIALSSHILQYVRPVGFLQLLTSILIAGVFTVLSFGLARIAKAIKGVDPLSVALMPVVLVAASYAIMWSSEVLSKVVPISFSQAVTSIMISATFVVVSYGLPRIADAVKKVGLAQAALMPVVLVAMSVAIMASSHILSGVEVIPFMTLVNIALQAITLTVISVSMGLAMYFISDKLKLTPEKAIKSGLSMVIIATTIMATSLIMSVGSYEYYPSLSWTVGVAASMLAFGVGMSLIALSGVGIPALAIGAIGVIIIAATILATDAIISKGDYDKYPSLIWAGGVGLSLTAFGVVMAVTGMALPFIALGMLSVSLIANSIVKVSEIVSKGQYEIYPPISWIAGVGASLTSFGSLMIGSGIGLPLIFLGKFAIRTIAKSIVDVSKIISEGDYERGPSLSWAIGIGSLITAFGGGLMALGAMIGGTLGDGFLLLKSGAKGVNVVAQSIVDASFILAKGNYKDGPTFNWARGVSLAIGAFAPVYKTLASGGILKAIFGGGGVTPEKMKSAIVTISEGIVVAADFFANKKVSFKNGIPYEWARGVGMAIGAFAPVLKNLKSDGIFSIFTGGGASSAEMKEAILVISEGIVEAARFFGENIVAFNGSYPSEQWSRGVGSAIAAFGPAFKWASDNSSIFKAGTGFLRETLITVAESIVDISNILQKGIFNVIIDKSWISGIKESYKSFIDVVNAADEIGKKVLNRGLTKILDIASSIVNISNIISLGTFNKNINLQWIGALKASYQSFLEIVGVSQQIESLGKIYDIAYTIVKVSQIISRGVYDSVIKIEWLIGLRNSYQSFLEIVRITDEIGKLTLSRGLSKVFDIASTIVNISHIISSGVYDKVISLQWINTLKNSYQSFLEIVAITDEIGRLTLNRGINKVFDIASTIVGISHIISSGVYDKVINLQWINGIKSTYQSFLDIFKVSDEISKLSLNIGLTKISDIASTIVGISHIISSGVYDRIINLEWINGIKSSYQSFLEIFKVSNVIDKLSLNKISDIASTIVGISHIISSGAYDKIINLQWINGIKNTYQSFLEIVGITNEIGRLNIGFTKISDIASTIVGISHIISSGVYDKVINLQWLSGLRNSYQSFLEIVVIADEIGKLTLNRGLNKVFDIASTIVNISHIISSGVYDKVINLQWLSGLRNSYQSFLEIVGITDEIGRLTLSRGLSKVSDIASTIVNISHIISSGVYDKVISLQWINGIKNTYQSFLEIVGVSGQIGSLNKVFDIASTIVNISHIISSGVYDKIISLQWLSGLRNSYQSFLEIVGIVDQIGKLTLNRGLSKVSDIASSIVSISNILSTGNFDKVVSIQWLSGLRNSYQSFLEIVGITDQIGRLTLRKVSDISSSIAEISHIISSGIYNTIISDNWSSGIGKTISAFGPVFKWVNENSTLFGAGTSFLKETIIVIAESIVEVSQIIKNGIFDAIIDPKWFDGLKQSYYSFFEIVNIADDVSKRTLKTGVNKVTDIVSTISNISKIISEGRYDTLIPTNWMSNLTSNLISYQKLLDYLSGTSNMSEILGLNLSALRKSYDLSKMSKDYDKLATSIRNLSSSIQEINIEKLNALKTLTGSVVLMSLMDSEQFESMMDALEEKASTLVDVINQIDEGVSGKELKISSESDKKGATIEDLIKVMNRMDSRLGQIAATNNNISNYVNQLKANPKGGASMKNK